jgi:diaminopimelate epimerase
MGEPILDGPKIPTTLPGNPVLPTPKIVKFLTNSSDQRERVEANRAVARIGWRPCRPVANADLDLGDCQIQVTCVSMGNPHCVTFVEQPTDHWVLGIGPRIERDPHFPKRVNAEFVQVVSPREVRMRVWERGSGETLACGTGACAVCVAGALTGRTERKILVHLTGGDLELDWADDNHVYLTGEAVEVFYGEWP